jgi:hypothetical protein
MNKLHSTSIGPFGHLCRHEPMLNGKNPRPLTLVKDPDTGRFEDAHLVKNLDCSFYNECLDIAVAGKWKSFGCGECTAHEALDIEQKVQDVLGLLAARLAMENVAKTGKAGRTRGVKPGADAKTSSKGRAKKKTG